MAVKEGQIIAMQEKYQEKSELLNSLYTNFVKKSFEDCEPAKNFYTMHIAINNELN